MSRRVAQALPALAALLMGGSARLWLRQHPARPAPVERGTRPGALIPAQSARTKDLAAGKFLVASRGLRDPNFSATVILLVQYDQQGVVGLVINRRTGVLLSEAFPHLKGAKGRPDAVYQGGPVRPEGALALIRSRTKPKDAEHILGDIYLTASEATLEKTLASKTKPSGFHLYLGYGGWTAEQLRREVELGAWFIFPGDAATVFDANPESLWSRWILKTEGQFAFGRSADSATALVYRGGRPGVGGVQDTAPIGARLKRSPVGPV